MPMAIPLIAAAGSVAGGIAAGGIIGGMMIAGGAMTAIGALTGSKKLQKFGGILSLAGGVAGLATGAWSSAASSIAEQSATESFRALELGAQAGADAAGAAGAAAGGLGDVAALGQANLAATDIGVGAASAGAAPMAAAPSIPATVNLGSLGGTTATTGGLDGALAVGKQVVSDAGSGMLDSLKSGMTWAEKNPRLTQAGAGILQAGLGAIGQQEQVKTQLKAQEEAQQRARDRLNASVAGIRVPVYQKKGG